MHTQPRMIRSWILILLSLSFLLQATADVTTETIGANLHVLRGDVNGDRLERNGKTLFIYGDPREKPDSADTVLFTHHERCRLGRSRAGWGKGGGCPGIC